MGAAVVNYLLKYNTEYDSDIVKYGLEGMYILIEKTILVLISALYLGLLKETVAFMIAYALIRTTISGVHFEDGLACSVTSILLFTTIASIVEYRLPATLKVIICLFALISIWKFAPANANRNFNNKETLKLISVIIGLVYSFLALSDLYFSNYLIYSLLIGAIVINKNLFPSLKGDCND